MPCPRLVSSSQRNSELGLPVEHDSILTSMTCTPPPRRQCRVLCQPCTRSAAFKKSNTLTTRSAGLGGTRGAGACVFNFCLRFSTPLIISPLQTASASSVSARFRVRCPPLQQQHHHAAAVTRCNSHTNLLPTHLPRNLSSTPAGGGGGGE